MYKALDPAQKRACLQSFQAKSQTGKEFAWVKSFEVESKETDEAKDVDREKWCTGPMLII